MSTIKSHGLHRMEKFPRMQGFSNGERSGTVGQIVSKHKSIRPDFFLDLSLGSVAAVYKRNYYSCNCHGI